MTHRAALGALLLAGCVARERTPPAAAKPPAAETAELALHVSDSVAIWYTGARADTSADGTACRERVMEIRTRDRSIPIPLLYTGEVPVLTSDSTIEVHLWRHCVPADLYRVNLRSGHPTKAGA